MTYQRWTRGLAVTAMAAVLSGCFGGSSSSSSSSHSGSSGSDGGNGGGTGGGSGGNTTQSGQFIDSPVSGLGYHGSAGSGLTDASGRFSYQAGETLSFTLGQIPLGSAAGAATVTPLDLFGSDIHDQRVVNLARLLQSLDRDGDADNGIQLDSTALTQDPLKTVNFDVDPYHFGTETDIANPELASYIAKQAHDGKLVDTRTARQHLSCALIDAGREDQASIWCNSRRFVIEPGENASTEALVALIEARPGDIVEFSCGFFEMDTALVLQDVENITIRGCGMDGTVLSFANSDSAEGLLAVNSRGLEVSDLTVADTPGDGIKLKGVNHGTLRNVRTIWGSGGQPLTAGDYQGKLQVACTLPARDKYGPPSLDYVVSPESGRYGIYPVESDNILVDNAESIGASDAGIYVGQTNNAIIKNSRAAYNVMGFEIENVRGGEYIDNIAECNTGGFLIYDLDYLTQYGDRSRMHGNRAINNNQYNFAAGGFVSYVPRGSGFITLGYDQIEVFNNHFENHDTASMIIVSYNLIGLGNEPGDRQLDGYTEGLHIHGNTFVNAGSNPPPPDFETILKSINREDIEGDIDVEGLETLLPTLVRLKNNGRGAHIVWDGILDEWDRDCPYPTVNGEANGDPIPQDARGKPLLGNQYTNPDCRYNAYKFDADIAASGDEEPGMAHRILPDWYMCIDTDNNFDPLSQPYANFRGLEGLDALDPLFGGGPEMLSDPDFVMAAAADLPNLAAKTDISVHDCKQRFGRSLAPLAPVVIEPFVPSGGADDVPSDEEIAALCTSEAASDDINRAALGVNCPLLQHYQLFTDAEDPRSLPRGGGVPYVLNTKLFSDHALKYRVAYLPPNQSAVYREASVDENYNVTGENVTLNFPVGTVLAKSFAFRDDSAGIETVVETRLLIKRASSSGQARWVGLPYVWETGTDGKRIARLSMKGGKAAANWDYVDADSGTPYQGSTDSYGIPHANQCITCHGNDDALPGAAPIGPKPRNLNRAYKAESDFMKGKGQDGVPIDNQLLHWIDSGLLSGAPEERELDANRRVAGIPFLPRYNLAGDSGHPADSPADIEARLRAYLEVNCQHCHNDKGMASNTGLYLDHLRKINGNYGICKTPTAAGTEGSGGHSYVIVPTKAEESIMPFRMRANTVEAKMPPIGRSTAHDDAAALLELWINTVVTNDYNGGKACGSSGGTGGLPSL